MATMKALEWIFFDVGDALIDESGYTNWKQDLVLRSVQAYQDTLRLEDVKHVWISASAQSGSLMQNAARLLLPNQKQADKAIEVIKSKHVEMNEARKKQTVYPEALDVLRLLSKTYRLGILANQPVETRHMLAQAGLLELFTSTNLSGDYPFQKPDPRYFLQTLKDAGAEISRSVLVDDNIERGLAPAKQIGMRTVWYKHTERTIPDHTVDAVIESLQGLPAALGTL
ncbi:HAD family hydrolase [Candidatus Uhrbacteria bacterium]|nr:HAD family hydrolase [Candidatus Uhrbacteria bacterium]